MKTKIAASIAAIGGLCTLCCIVPIAGFLGLGALEVFFCDSPWAIGMGVGLMTIGLGTLAYRYWKPSCSSQIGPTCSTACGCR